MDRWSQLSMSEKSDLMSLYIRNGISSLEEIKKHYNSYQDGGIVDNPNNPKKKPKFQQSEEQYYDRNNDIIYAQDSIGEGYQHEYFHARPNTTLLNNLKPYYENLNDNRLIELGADLPFVKRLDNDPNHFYSPEEIGARVTAARYMLNKAGINNIDIDFLRNARKNELQYGDNFRDLLHMYNDENLLQILNTQYSNGGHLYQDGGPDDKENKQVKAPTWLKMWNHRNDEHYMTDKYSPQELDTLRRRLYANLLPYNYPLREFKKAMSNPNTSYDKNSYPAERLEYIPSVRSIEFRDEQWAKYLGIPEELQRNRKFGDHIALSEYKPTISKENRQYYKIDGDDIAKKDVAANLVKLYNDFRTNKVLDEDGNPRRPTSNGNYSTANSLMPASRSNYGKYLTQLGDFTVGSGIDSKRGQYVSYYDSWGLNPLKGASSRYPLLTKIVKSSNREDLTQGLGNPFEFYDRVYLDDYYGMSSKPTEPNTYYGGWLPEIDITTEKR